MSEVLKQQIPATLLPETQPESVKMENVPLQNAGMYKSLLNQHAQKSSIQPPIYQTYNEGSQHQPQFRSRVWIDGAWYTSPNTFSQRKAAEMEVSRIAFLAIMQKRKDEAANLIREDTVFCKSILIEYAVRMNLVKPCYQTTQSDLSTPLFSSTLVFNGVAYTGEFARTKIEAQRLAARAVIFSILDSESGNVLSNVMSEIINSKFKLNAALNKAKNSSNIQVGITPGSVHTENNNDIQLSKPTEVQATPGTNNIPPSAPITEPFLGQNTSIQFSKPNEVQVIPGTNNIPPSSAITEPFLGPNKVQATPGTNNILPSATITEPFLGQNTSIPAIDLLLNVIQPPKPEVPTSVTPPALSFAPISEQAPLVESTTAVDTPLHNVGPPTLEEIPLVNSTSGKKRNRKNKKKAQKKARVEAPLPVDVVPLSQITPCSVAQ